MNRVFKNYFKVTCILLLFLCSIIILDCCAIEQQPSSKRAIDKFILEANHLQGGRVESFFISGNTFTKVKMPEDNTDLNIHMTWNSPLLFEFVDALKKDDFQKGEYDDISKFSLHFYDRKGNKILWVYLAYRCPGVVINGEAFKPTPALMQSLRHFMPYLAYWQISHSAQYEQYFKEAEIIQGDPNSVKK